MQSPPQTPRRRRNSQERDEDGYLDIPGSSPKDSPQKRKKSRIEPQSPLSTPTKGYAKALVWRDIPQWKSDSCPLLKLPVEILDNVSLGLVVRSTSQLQVLPLVPCHRSLDSRLY